MSDNLATKLANFNNSLSEAEKINYKLLLGLAASGLAPTCSAEIALGDAEALNAVGESLVKLQPYSARISPNGIAWKGRPAFLTEELLFSLQEEARKIRPSAVDLRNHSLGCGAPLANKLAISSEMCALVREKSGDVKPTGIASFIFYDQEGQGIDPHVDTDIFSLNVIVMLEQKTAGTPPSRLIVFPPKSSPEPILLEPGDMVIMFAGSVVHGREHLSKNEKVTLLTFGFQMPSG